MQVCSRRAASGATHSNLLAFGNAVALSNSNFRQM